MQTQTNPAKDRTKKIIVLDIETNIKRHVFDISWVVVNYKGKIFQKRQCIIAPTFFENALFWEEKRTLYSNYLTDSSYPAILTTFKQAMAGLYHDMKVFGVKRVYAYNASFDTGEINKRCKLEDVFNPLGQVEIACIWSMACQTIFQKKAFRKWAYTNKEQAMSNAGNYKTSAEIAYSFLTDNPTFEEEHTGLQDCLIEYEILQACRAMKKQVVTGICYNPWLIVQDNEQIANLPKQFRTMQMNLLTDMPAMSKKLRALNKNIGMEKA